MVLSLINKNSTKLGKRNVKAKIIAHSIWINSKKVQQIKVVVIFKVNYTFKFNVKTK